MHSEEESPPGFPTNNVAVRTDSPTRELELRPAQGAETKGTVSAPSTSGSAAGLMGFRQHEK